MFWGVAFVSICSVKNQIVGIEPETGLSINVGCSIGSPERTRYGISEG